MAAAPEQARRRWFRITPDRCVLGLLALEGFLLLSAWFRWFPFNQHKGWTVLIAIAAVGAALLLMFLWFLAALVFRWRFQFSILSLLLLVVVVAVPCSWLATEMKAARKQREVVGTIVRTGGAVAYDWQKDVASVPQRSPRPPGPAWLRKLLGDDFLADVVAVTLTTAEVTDEVLDHLRALNKLRDIELEGTQVTDAGIRSLQRALPGCSVHGSDVVFRELLAGLPKDSQRAKSARLELEYWRENNWGLLNPAVRNPVRTKDGKAAEVIFLTAPAMRSGHGLLDGLPPD